MKRLLVSVLLIIVLMMPLIVAPSGAGASKSDGDKVSVTSRAAHIVVDQHLPGNSSLNRLEPKRGKYICQLPSWLGWLCNALNAYQCPSCYNFMT